jgi:peroxiredoxin
LKKAKYILIYAAIIGVLGFLMFSFGPEPGDEGPVVLREGMPAPGVKLADLNGKNWDLSQLRGSVVIVNFWATWCPPCKEEMPSLNKLYEKYRPGGNLEILAILFKDAPESARTYVKKGGFDFPILIDPSDFTAGTYGLTGVPETYIIDKKGILRKIFIGPVEFDTQSSYAFIEKLLSEPAE